MLRHLVEAFQPASDKVALMAHFSELPTLLPENQDVKLSHIVRGADEPCLIIKQRADVRTDLLKELGELEVLDDGVRVVPDPYNLSLFPLYYTPYSYYNPYVEGLQNPFMAQSYRNPLLYNGGLDPYYDDYPYGPYKGLYRHPSVPRDEYSEDDHFRYDIYSHPAVKPVAIVPGDEYAVYYPASYPILSTVPIFAAPPLPSVAAVSPIAGPGQVPIMPGDVQL
jgi:hypothetical protein